MDPYFTQAYPQGINPASFPHFIPNGSVNVAGPSSSSSAGPSNPRPTQLGGQRTYTGSSAMTTQSPASSSRSHESPTHNGAAEAGPSGGPVLPYVEPHQDLQSFLESFWTRQVQETEDREEDFKGFGLPLARIKKVMKSDEEVKMISAEVMFSKACESESSTVARITTERAVFISELTCRAWLVAESHKRRTLQKSDVAEAIGLSDMFDFLIDIVPREEEGEAHGNGNGHAQVDGGEGGGKSDESREEEGEEEEEETG